MVTPYPRGQASHDAGKEMTSGSTTGPQVSKSNISNWSLIFHGFLHRYGSLVAAGLLSLYGPLVQRGFLTYYGPLIDLRSP